ncbi:MAG TPA: hypothetical protein VIR27_01220 [Mycobacteriales bacterium]
MIGHRPGALLVHTGLGLFVTGLVLVLVTVVPFLFGAHERPLWLDLACLSAPIGLVLTLTGLARGARDARRAVLTAGVDWQQKPPTATMPAGRPKKRSAVTARFGQ